MIIIPITHRTPQFYTTSLQIKFITKLVLVVKEMDDVYLYNEDHFKTIFI
jgi:hypothetical protein